MSYLDVLSSGAVSPSVMGELSVTVTAIIVEALVIDQKPGIIWAVGGWLRGLDASVSYSCLTERGSV